MEGCQKFIVSGSQLNWNQPALAARGLYLDVHFLPDNSARTERKVENIAISQRPLYIHRPSNKFAKQYFTPGLPYYGYVR